MDLLVTSEIFPSQQCHLKDVRFEKEFSVCIGCLGSSWNALVVLPGSIEGTTAGGA
jgi:hypothetical protein